MVRTLAAGLLLVAAEVFGAGPVYVGIDAEFGVATSTSAQAIQQGVQVAIDEINQAGGVLGGRRLDIVTRDNRAVTAIGVDNLRDLAAVPDLVAVFGGKYSPIYIECLPVTHALRLILLDPWGSADGITDHRYQPSYTFRLSLKDEWAAPAFLNFAKQHHRATRVGVLLPNTAWGRSNQAALERAAKTIGVTVVGDRWYNWGDATLLPQYRQLHAAGAQAIVLIANEVEGALFVREMAALPAAERLPIVAHWGLTGGQFAQLAGESLHQVDFAVIQTFSFMGRPSPAATRVLAALKQRYGVDGAAAVHSPVGVGHAYDLTHLLARAINKAGTTDRASVRTALEQLGPYDGLVQKYARPFTPERHDALSPTDIFFARYTADDVLVPIAWRNGK
ncbi:MAG: ABC transporter substrate-binding protein [Burkholderiales bacterium]